MSRERSFSYCGLTTRANYNDTHSEGHAWRPVCGHEQIAPLRSMGEGEAIAAAKAKVVVHMRAVHKLFEIDDEEDTPEAGEQSPNEKPCEEA